MSATPTAIAVETTWVGRQVRRVLIGRRSRAVPRERDVLALMAEGRTNAGIARRLWLTERTVEGHVASILARLGLTVTDDDHRRVLAVLAHLGHASPWR